VRAPALFTDAGITRADVLKQMEPRCGGGEPQRGRTHYENLCSTCTRWERSATPWAGSDRDFTQGAETLLSDILDPNAAVNTEYIGFTIEDTEGESIPELWSARRKPW
jgi:hypothetical protein